MLTFISCIVCKFVYYTLKMLKKGASTLPGRLALKVKSDVLINAAKGVKVMLVTGTNGHTTTCRILEKALANCGKSYFINDSGANLIWGITTSFLMNCNIFGKNKKEYAIVECDENAFKTVSLYLKPEVVLVTNVFRDQLDRFGEISTTLSAIRTSISNLPNSAICLCADCSLTYSLSRDFPNNKIYTYGVNLPFDKNSLKTEVSDAEYCIFCKTKYDFSYKTYGHLGGFSCPSCGYSRNNPDVAVEEIIEIKTNYSKFKINLDGDAYDIKINVPGTFNVYNATGAAAALKCIGFDSKLIVDSLEQFDSAIGRMETFVFNNHDIGMMLVKNPAGFNQVVTHLSNRETEFSVVFCLNDNIADGTDISWVWDVNFDNLFESKNLINIYTCGKRAYDMALVLKYNGYDKNIIVIENEDYDKEIEYIMSENRDVVIVPTYTSLMKQRGKIASKFDRKDCK